jgi:flagellar basal-body rod protein FlgF
MDLGLNIAASGMLAAQVEQDQLSNDLANASTPGYKPSSTQTDSFGPILMSNIANGQTIGTIDSGVTTQKATTNLAQGALEQESSQPLDFAISGAGFFAVRTANGVEYTRNGQFNVNNKDDLMDQFGDEVLSQNGDPIKVSAAGTVAPTALGLFNVTNPSQLGDNNFSGQGTAGRATGTVSANALESSGVDAIETLTEMESDYSAYEAGQQTIQTIGDTMNESATSVAQVPGV